MRAGLAAALALVLAATAAPAHADDKEACIAASEGADRLDDAHKLIELRDRLTFCARDVCPTVVRQECVRRLEELDKRIPTIVVRATDAQGGDIVDARVLVDGKVIAEQIDGNPIKLDPGPHTVRVQPAHGEAKAQKVVAAEGDHLRAVTLSFAADTAVATAPPADGGVTIETTPGKPTQRWIGVGVMTVGVIGIVVGVVMLPSAFDNFSKYKNEGQGLSDCPESNPTGFGIPTCHVRDSAGLTFNERGNSFLLPAIIFGGVGVVAATVGTILVLTSFESKRVVTRGALRFSPAFGPGYAGAGLSGSF